MHSASVELKRGKIIKLLCEYIAISNQQDDQITRPTSPQVFKLWLIKNSTTKEFCDEKYESVTEWMDNSELSDLTLTLKTKISLDLNWSVLETFVFVCLKQGNFLCRVLYAW
jgi:hypothetical protein